MDKIDKLRVKMKEQNVDLIVLSPGANLNWLLGVNPYADERPLLFFLTLSKSAFLMPELEAKSARQDTDIEFYNWSDTSGPLKAIDKILTDPRWDLKFIGMQIIIEGLALAAFNVARQGTNDPVFKDMLYLIIRDEARHVTFGVNYLEEFLKTLSEEELEERAQFAYEACLVMRGRLMSADVYENFGWDKEDAQAFAQKADVANNFQHLLFTRVVPNLSRIGLLTEKVRPLYDELGVLEYENWPTDGDIDWVSLEQPLDFSETA